MNNTLPPQGLSRIKDILPLLPFGKTKLYKLVQAGKFPKPIKFGANITAWRNQDVLDWIAEQTTANTAQI